MTTTNSPEPFVAQTSRFGEVQVDPQRVITMPQGMVGFPRATRYVLLQHRADSPLHWLQSLDQPDLAFVVVNPLMFDHQYQLVLGRTETELLKVKDPAQVQAWVVVTIPQGHPEKMTANMKAPVVVNLANRYAAQVILDKPGLELRKPLVSAEGGQEGQEG